MSKRYVREKKSQKTSKLCPGVTKNTTNFVKRSQKLVLKFYKFILKNKLSSVNKVVIYTSLHHSFFSRLVEYKPWRLNRFKYLFYY